MKHVLSDKWSILLMQNVKDFLLFLSDDKNSEIFALPANVKFARCTSEIFALKSKREIFD